jgi:hypothetical protein
MVNDGILNAELDYAPNSPLTEGTWDIHLLYIAQGLLPECRPFWNLSESPFLQMKGNEHSVAVVKVSDFSCFTFAFCILELPPSVSGKVSNKCFDMIDIP